MFIVVKKSLFVLIFLSACAAPVDTPPTRLPTQNVIAVTPTALSSPEVTLHPVGPPFPRLSMVWPNPYEQPLADIARYDYVVLGDWTKEFIDQLHEINSNILLLTSTNASEVIFHPDDPSYNAYLQNIPYQWYLTQVGTTLRTDIDATQTTLPVEDLVLQGEDGEIELLVPGDTALIESESVYIESVDEVNKTMVVQRGYIRPASSHKSGTRLAAHISFWPNTWVLNLSNLSSVAMVDPSIGPERWADYNARVAAANLLDARWSGIFVDRSGPDASWLIGNSTARTIDPDQSNRLLSDYSGFDRAWNDGLRSYLDQLRSLIGSDQIILLSWGIPYYSAVNGSNFEGIPDESWFDPWHSQILGTLESGSYFEWMSQSRQPNLTMIETYEDNSRVAPTDKSGYSNPCNSKVFIPNYQKMRFGLTTALLNDGYFSYEMNTQGHGSLCLMWFDEYDNAGQGRGYLGYPLAAARRLTESVVQNLLPSNGFESDREFAAWETWADTEYKLSAQLDQTNPVADVNSIRLDVTQAQGEHWRATFSYQPLTLTRNTDYTLSFYARADKERPIKVWVQKASGPWDVWLDFGNFDLTKEWQKFDITIGSQGEDSEARLVFGLGEAAGSVWLDGVGFYRGNADVWRRDFEQGIVLVNATDGTVTIPLDAFYRKINGLQDRSVNDGSWVNQVEISSRDGIILLK